MSTRRELLKEAVTYVTFGMLAMLMTGCKKKKENNFEEIKNLKCNDTSNLTEEEKNTRIALGYLDLSPLPQKQCQNCQFYIFPQTHSCGKCELMKGPVHPLGYCNAWVKKSV